MTMPAMDPLDRLPSQTIFTFVDIGPRLITLTHHDAIAGPYHRNGAAILDVHLRAGEKSWPVADKLAAAEKLRWIGYLSTIGVYGDHGGAWIDETAECRPTSKRSRQRLEIERRIAPQRQSGPGVVAAPAGPRLEFPAGGASVVLPVPGGASTTATP